MLYRDEAPYKEEGRVYDTLTVELQKKPEGKAWGWVLLVKGMTNEGKGSDFLEMIELKFLWRVLVVLESLSTACIL